jgi:hypothetical protein
MHSNFVKILFKKYSASSLEFKKTQASDQPKVYQRATLGRIYQLIMTSKQGSPARDSASFIKVFDFGLTFDQIQY